MKWSDRKYDDFLAAVKAADLCPCHLHTCSCKAALLWMHRRTNNHNTETKCYTAVPPATSCLRKCITPKCDMHCAPIYTASWTGMLSQKLPGFKHTETQEANA